MRITQRSLTGAASVLLLLGAVACSEAPAALPDGVPSFLVDATWPADLPENWIMGLPLGIFVDSRDHIWVVQNWDALADSELGAMRDPPSSECCTPAPPVIEFDMEGNVVQTWGGPGEGYHWPRSAHGIYLDHNDFVWIASNNDHQILKFTRDGRHVLTIGDASVSQGSNDPDHLGGPAGTWVDPETNELYVADGYRNRRVVVYDAETGRYLRHWGAYGELPADGPQPSRAPGEPSRQFSTVHGLAASHDGLLYVADRGNSRVQVFRKDGTFVAERRVAPEGIGGSAFDVAFSPDPDQRYLYVADGQNHKVRILRRSDLEVIGEFGRGGRQAGNFTRVHNLAVDSRGNIYTTEAADGRRIQRFLFQGVMTAGR